MRQLVAQIVVDGSVLSALYGLGAAGFALIFGVSRVLLPVFRSTCCRSNGPNARAPGMRAPTGLAAAEQPLRTQVKHQHQDYQPR